MVTGKHAKNQPHMSSGADRIRQRIAVLKQRERELRDQFSQSQSSVERINEIAAQLLAVAAEIAELELQLPSAQGKPH